MTTFSSRSFKQFAAAALAVAVVRAAAGGIDARSYEVTAEPSAVMLNFARGANSRGFAWQTDTSVSESEVRLVRGGGTPGDDAFDRSDLVFTGTCKRVGRPFLNRHKVFATGLAPGRYSYRLGGAGRYARGSFSVRDGRGPVTVLNLNDAQTKEADKLKVWENTLAVAAKTVGGADGVDFIFSGGDLIDAWFRPCTNYVHGFIGRPLEWGLAVDATAPHFPGVPWVSSSGNHDFWLYGDFMAVDYPKGVVPGCESLDYGELHVATIPYVEGKWSPRHQAVVDWLARDLAANRRRGDARWTVVGIHWGPYTTGDHGSLNPGVTNLVLRLGPMFASNRVDLVLQGHDHTFSKTLPYRWDGPGYTTSLPDESVVLTEPKTVCADGRTYDLNPCGTYFISAGCAGHRVGENCAYAVSDGPKSHTKLRKYKIAVGRLKVDSSWGKAGDAASVDLPASMFAVLRFDGGRMSCDFYVVGRDGVELYDSLNVMKR